MKIKDPFFMSLEELRYRYADTQKDRAAQRLERLTMSVGASTERYDEIRQAKEQLKQTEIWAQDCFNQFMLKHPALLRK